MNNASLEGEVRVNALSVERDALATKVTEHESEVAGKRSVVEERARQVVVVEKKLADARTTLEAATKSWRKLAEDKAALEESLKKADFPGEDEAEDTVVLKRVELIGRVECWKETWWTLSSLVLIAQWLS